MLTPVSYTHLDYARVDYENHWALSENTVARGYDIGYARTFKNARWARVYADYYNWRGREAVKVGYYKLPKRDAIKGFKAVSYTHLDVYKRQGSRNTRGRSRSL